MNLGVLAHINTGPSERIGTLNNLTLFLSGEADYAQQLNVPTKIFDIPSPLRSEEVVSGNLLSPPHLN